MNNSKITGTCLSSAGYYYILLFACSPDKTISVSFTLFLFFNNTLTPAILFFSYLDIFPVCACAPPVLLSCVYYTVICIFCSLHVYIPHPFITLTIYLLLPYQIHPVVCLSLVRRLLSSCPVQSNPLQSSAHQSPVTSYIPRKSIPHHSSSSPPLHTDIHSSLPVVNLRFAIWSLLVALHFTHTPQLHIPKGLPSLPKAYSAY